MYIYITMPLQLQIGDQEGAAEKQRRYVCEEEGAGKE